MAKRDHKQLKLLASALSGNERDCPVPASHDRLNETHYFLHRMGDTYHEPDPFRFHLHAFIQSFESALDLLDIESQNDGRFSDFREARKSFIQTKTMQTLKKVRDAAVHLESLVPASFVTVGWFQYGRPKSCLKMPINPMTPSINVLADFRNFPSFVNPHRSFDGEEVGVLREWHLGSVTDDELLSFCSSRFEELAKLVEDSHIAVGSVMPGGMCSMKDVAYRIIRESEFFPEVIAAWNGPYTHSCRATGETLDFRQHPSEASRILHSLSNGARVLGWVGAENLWSGGYTSVLIGEMDGKPVRENTAAFFKSSHAEIVKVIALDDDAQDDETN